MDQSQILYEFSTINSCISQWNIDYPNNQFPQYWYIKYTVTAGQWVPSCIPTYTIYDPDNIIYYNNSIWCNQKVNSINQTNMILKGLLNK